MEITLTNLPAIVAAVTFAVVTLAILTERLHLTVAAFFRSVGFSFCPCHDDRAGD